MSKTLFQNYKTHLSQLNNEASRADSEITIGSYLKVIKDSEGLEFTLIKINSKTAVRSGNVTYDYKVSGPGIEVVKDSEGSILSVQFYSSLTVANILSKGTMNPSDDYIVELSSSEDVSSVFASIKEQYFTE